VKYAIMFTQTWSTGDSTYLGRRLLTGELSIDDSVLGPLHANKTYSRGSPELAAISSYSVTLDGKVYPVDSAYGVGTPLPPAFVIRTGPSGDIVDLQGVFTLPGSTISHVYMGTGALGTYYDQQQVDASTGVVVSSGTYTVSRVSMIMTTFASAVTAGGGTLNGTVSSNGASTAVIFQYGTTIAYGTTITATQSPLAAGANNAAVSAAISGLACGTLYHFRIVAVNSEGAADSADGTFTTAACGHLSVAFAGNGIGTVTGSPAGIACSPNCSQSYAPDTSVTLTATPLPGSAFGWWSGACVGTGACTLTMYGTRSVTATFVYIGSDYSYDYVQKAYVAYYGRPADPAGQAYWAGRMDVEGGSLNAIIGQFGYSEEFNHRYGDMGDDELVSRIYLQLLNRDPDPAGRAFYVGKLKAGEMTLQTITLNVINGIQAGTSDAPVVANKLDVADYYTAMVAAGCAYGTDQDGVNALFGVTADPTTAATAEATINSRCGV
jgi:hypothetical protein